MLESACKRERDCIHVCPLLPNGACHASILFPLIFHPLRTLGMYVCAWGVRCQGQEGGVTFQREQQAEGEMVCGKPQLV